MTSEQSTPSPATAPTGEGTGAGGRAFRRDGTGRRVEAWRRAVLPFMMTAVAVLATFFLVASVLQLYRLQDQIHRGPVFEDRSLLDELKSAAASPHSVAALELARWRLLLALERHVVERRYHQANVLLVARVWVHYLGFVTGMILALVGAVFILGRLSDESASEVKGTGTGWSLDLRTASPGIVLAVLGTGLMALTLVTRHDIRVADTPLYVRSVMPVGATGPGTPQGWPGATEPGAPGVGEQELERFKRESLEGQKK